MILLSVYLHFKRKSVDGRVVNVIYPVGCIFGYG